MNLLKTSIVKAFFTTVLLISIPSLLAYSQQPCEKTIITNGFGLRSTPEMLLLKGATIEIECDSVYLINSKRFRFYTTIQEYIKNDDALIISEKLIASYEKSIHENEIYYLDLLNNCRQTDLLAKQAIQESELVLVGLKQTLKNANAELENTKNELRALNKDIHQMNRLANRKNMLVGVGGIGLGLLIGILLN